MTNASPALSWNEIFRLFAAALVIGPLVSPALVFSLAVIMEGKLTGHGDMFSSVLIMLALYALPGVLLAVGLLLWFRRLKQLNWMWTGVIGAAGGFIALFLVILSLLGFGDIELALNLGLTAAGLGFVTAILLWILRPVFGLRRL